MAKISDFTPDKSNANKGTRRGLDTVADSLQQINFDIDDVFYWLDFSDSQVDRIDLSDLFDENELMTTLDVSEEKQNSSDKKRNVGTPGYKIVREGGKISGVTLLSLKQFGKELVIRLKKIGANHQDEVKFWGELLARLVPNQTFRYVTAPPPGTHFDYHLATDLAKVVASQIGVEYQNLFVNQKPANHTEFLPEKLQNDRDYSYAISPTGANILVIDDVVHTRRTARGCIMAASGDNLYFVWLYGA